MHPPTAGEMFGTQQALQSRSRRRCSVLCIRGELFPLCPADLHRTATHHLHRVSLYDRTVRPLQNLSMGDCKIPVFFCIVVMFHNEVLDHWSQFCRTHGSEGKLAAASSMLGMKVAMGEEDCRFISYEHLFQVRWWTGCSRK